jgi:hypothetical protein
MTGTNHVCPGYAVLRHFTVECDGGDLSCAGATPARTNPLRTHAEPLTAAHTDPPPSSPALRPHVPHGEYPDPTAGRSVLVAGLVARLAGRPVHQAPWTHGEPPHLA